jgi:6-phosphofructokinase 1
VRDVHRAGGTLLGSSRGGFDLTAIVDAIETRKISIALIVGGDGTASAARLIYEEVARRRLPIAICHVPKTVDRDIALLDNTFGFDTAVEEAQRAINAASVEASSFPDCVAIVKLMGRNSGFIAASSTLASRDVDCCLIPEIPFNIEGPGGVIEYIESTLDKQGKCVIVVAEGAGHTEKKEIGLSLSSTVKKHFETTGREVSHKYLDPTYQVRALPPIASDSILCTLIAHAAVHGAMAGFTGFCAGPINNHNVLIPLLRIAGKQAKVDPNGRVWQRVMSSTQQPIWAYDGDKKEVQL